MPFLKVTFQNNSTYLFVLFIVMVKKLKKKGLRQHVDMVTALSGMVPREDLVHIRKTHKAEDIIEREEEEKVSSDEDDVVELGCESPSSILSEEVSNNVVVKKKQFNFKDIIKESRVQEQYSAILSRKDFEIAKLRTRCANSDEAVISCNKSLEKLKQELSDLNLQMQGDEVFVKVRRKQDLMRFLRRAAEVGTNRGLQELLKWIKQEEQNVIHDKDSPGDAMTATELLQRLRTEERTRISCERELKQKTEECEAADSKVDSLSKIISAYGNLRTILQQTKETLSKLKSVGDGIKMEVLSFFTTQLGIESELSETSPLFEFVSHAKALEVRVEVQQEELQNYVSVREKFAETCSDLFKKFRSFRLSNIKNEKPEEDIIVINCDSDFPHISTALSQLVQYSNNVTEELIARKGELRYLQVQYHEMKNKYKIALNDIQIIKSDIIDAENQRLANQRETSTNTEDKYVPQDAERNTSIGSLMSELKERVSFMTQGESINEVMQELSSIQNQFMQPQPEQELESNKESPQLIIPKNIARCRITGREVIVADDVDRNNDFLKSALHNYTRWERRLDNLRTHQRDTLERLQKLLQVELAAQRACGNRILSYVVRRKMSAIKEILETLPLKELFSPPASDSVIDYGPGLDLPELNCVSYGYSLQNNIRSVTSQTVPEVAKPKIVVDEPQIGGLILPPIRIPLHSLCVVRERGLYV